MEKELRVNCGHRKYGYKDAFNVPQEIKDKVVIIPLDDSKSPTPINWKHLIAPLTAAGILAFFQIEPPVVSAMAIDYSPTINTGPLDVYGKEIYWTMVKSLFYISLPVYGWIGYVFAFSGNNAGKRTVAKVALFSLLGGTAFIIAAPWVARESIDFAKAVFSKYIQV